MSLRTADITRNTKETQIHLCLALDCPNPATPDTQIKTDLPFLDHMLTALACHGQFGLTLEGRGDVHVDPHHLVEDVGIALGNAIRDALPGYAGIQRAGSFAFPMDGTLAVVALDLCGRPNLVWNVTFGHLPIGTLDPHLFREFFKGLVDGMRGTLHVHVPCIDNDHHGVEAVFKAFARALRQAVTPLGNPAALSTKGMLDV